MFQETLKDCPEKTSLITCNSQREKQKILYGLETLIGINSNPSLIKVLGDINFDITNQKAVTYPYITNINDKIASFSSIVISQDSDRNDVRTEVLEIMSFDSSDFLYVRYPSANPKEIKDQKNGTVISCADPVESNIEKIGEFLTRRLEKR